MGYLFLRRRRRWPCCFQLAQDEDCSRRREESRPLTSAFRPQHVFLCEIVAPSFSTFDIFNLCVPLAFFFLTNQRETVEGIYRFETGRYAFSKSMKKRLVDLWDWQPKTDVFISAMNCPLSTRRITGPSCSVISDAEWGRMLKWEKSKWIWLT